MKKKLKKRERGRIALLLALVVAVLAAAAVLLVSLHKSSRSSQKSAPQTNSQALPDAFNQAAFPQQATLPNSLLLVSYPSLFSFYYA